MARPYPSTTRATNADRTAVLTLLDAAFADGQLDVEEHDLRTDLVADARTLGDLESLTSDLQDATPPRPTTSLRDADVRTDPAVRRQRFLAGTLAAAVAAGVAAFWFVGRDDADAAPVAAPTATADLDALPARVIPTPDLRTAEGLTQFIGDYRATFGDTVVDVLYVYDDDASVYRALPREANRQARYSYRYGFTPYGDVETRPIDTPTVDLATIDLTALTRVLDETPALVNVPDGDITVISVEDVGYERGAAIDVHVRNEFDESGWLRLTPAGDVLDTYPFGG